MQAVIERPAARPVEQTAVDAADQLNAKYARCISASKQVRWEIDKHVIRGRKLDFQKKFLPDSLSKVNELAFLSPAEKRLMSQVQGRSYANIFGLVERYIAAKVLEVSRHHWMENQVALEALIRFADEELKHQELFRQVELLTAEGMPPGYRVVAEPNAVARAVLSKSTWAVLALTCHIEIFTQVHYRSSIESDPDLSELWKDVFLFHWKEESQHAILDELEWQQEDARLSPAERDAAVQDLIDLVGAVDGILQGQAAADADYFGKICGRRLSAAEQQQVAEMTLKAYRWQYIVSGVREPRFIKLLTSMITPVQADKVMTALAPLVA